MRCAQSARISIAVPSACRYERRQRDEPDRQLHPQDDQDGDVGADGW